MLTVSYDITDGTDAVANTATVTLAGFTDITFSAPAAMSIAENNDGSSSAVSLGQVQATASQAISYRFANGTQADGDFRIDANTGAVTYVGNGLNYEAGNQSANIVGSANMTTNVAEWLSGTANDNFGRMRDGDTGSGGSNNFAVHPRDADGSILPSVSTTPMKMHPSCSTTRSAPPANALTAAR